MKSQKRFVIKIWGNIILSVRISPQSFMKWTRFYTFDTLSAILSSSLISNNSYVAKSAIWRLWLFHLLHSIWQEYLMSPSSIQHERSCRNSPNLPSIECNTRRCSVSFSPPCSWLSEHRLHFSTSSGRPLVTTSRFHESRTRTLSTCSIGSNFCR